jgi:alkylation response protein AidB-like acyl-CoA dehydrogenase
MAGYSGTPLPKKLGIKPGLRIALPDLPQNLRRELQEAIDGCNSRADVEEPYDFVLQFAGTQRVLAAAFKHWRRQLAPAGMLWIAWPKKSSGVKSDLDENKVREMGLAAGLVDVKVCAINEVWSGLKFVIRRKDR